MSGRTLKILMVDDNEDDITIFCEALQERRSIDLVAILRDGDEALAYLRRDKGYENAPLPDLILLDINMPRKNGFETLTEIKEHAQFSALPVIMFTTSQREEDIARSYSIGACSYISKPADFADLENLLDRLTMYWTQVAHIPRLRHRQAT